jgi:hypothetical protein
MSGKFQPGTSGNPNGRPKRGESLTDILRMQGDIEDVSLEGEKVSRKTALGHKMWQLALRGKEATMRYLYDRVDGKPTQEIKVQSDVAIDAPIVLMVAGVEIESNDDDDSDSGTDE